MISVEEYFAQTEDALRRFFDYLHEYDELYKSTISPIAVIRWSREEELEENYKEWRERPDVSEEFDKAERARIEIDAKLFSLHVVSGSILQIANQAINLYSVNEQIPAAYTYLLEGVSKNMKRRAQKFTIGKDVNGIPLGLVIYAGRNQYNHLDTGTDLYPLSQNVFDQLAKHEHEEYGVLNPAFDITNPHLVCYSTNIVSALDWISYDAYIGDMNILLDSD